MKTEPKFKAGDTVYIIEAEEQPGAYRSNVVYSISEAEEDGDGDFYVIIGDDDDWWYFIDDDLKLVHSVDVNGQVTLDGFGL